MREAQTLRTRVYAVEEGLVCDSRSDGSTRDVLEEKDNACNVC